MPKDLANTADQFTAFLNRLQVHSTCKVPFCLRPKKGSDAPPSCRFFFPRPLFSDAVVTKEINHKAWLFSPARNQANLNQCAPILTFGWMANTDVQPPPRLQAVLSYIGKYVSKPEKSSLSYTELQSQILPYVNHRAPFCLSYPRCSISLLENGIGPPEGLPPPLADSRSGFIAGNCLSRLPARSSSRSLDYLGIR